MLEEAGLVILKSASVYPVRPSACLKQSKNVATIWPDASISIETLFPSNELLSPRLIPPERHRFRSLSEETIAINSWSNLAPDIRLSARIKGESSKQRMIQESTAHSSEESIMGEAGAARNNEKPCKGSVAAPARHPQELFSDESNSTGY